MTVYPPGDEKKERELDQVLWPPHCIADAPGAEFVGGFNHHLIDGGVVKKGTDKEVESYSAFCDPWKINTTELPDLLRSNGVTDVFLVGLAGDYCVKCTAMDAVDFGFKTWVVKDATRSVGSGGAEWDDMAK